MDNRRKSQRAKVAIAAEVECAGDTLIGETRDLSIGGVSVLLDHAPAEGSALQLALILTEDGIEHADEAPFETQAVVIWAAPTDTGHTMVGLRFKDLAQPQAGQLLRFLRAIGAAAS